MPNRLIKDSIRTSKSVNAMTDFQFRFWVYLITYVDDFGRGSADPELLKGFVFPRRKGVTEDTIKKTLADLANTGSVILYEVGGEPYLCFPNWSKHQTVRNKVSKFPSPESGTITNSIERKQLNAIEINCEQMNANAPVIQSNPESNPEANPRVTRAKRFTPPTYEDVLAYASERGNSGLARRFFDFYTAGDWHDMSGKPVKNWKQKFISWESRETGERRTSRGNGETAGERPASDWGLDAIVL